MFSLTASFLSTSSSTLPARPARAAHRVFVVAQANRKPATRQPVQARLGQKIRLFAVLQQGRGRTLRYYTDIPALRLNGRWVDPARVRPFRTFPAARFAWFLVQPHQQHKRLRPPNKNNPAYANAVLFGRRHGQWLGFDRLEYYETPLAGQTGSSLTVDRATPTHPKLVAHRGLGTMRYKVSVRISTLAIASPGAEAVGRRGILPTVMRLTFRESDDFVGFLTGYFNVPNVFGSSGPGRLHQTEQYQGADCADVIVGAARAAGARLPYTSAAGLRRYAPAITGRFLLNKRGIFKLNGNSTAASAGKPGPPVTLRWGRDVRRGDLMLIDYVGFTGSPRSWDHIAVLSKDRGAKNIFDPEDHIIHMGYAHGLVETRARDESPAVVQFLRFNRRILNAFARTERKLNPKR